MTISPVHIVARMTLRYSPRPFAMIVALVDCVCQSATGQTTSNATEKNWRGRSSLKNSPPYPQPSSSPSTMAVRMTATSSARTRNW